MVIKKAAYASYIQYKCSALTFFAGAKCFQNARHLKASALTNI